ncbi:MAG: NUDIX domain-containing protein [Hyphomonadaceae bacterium]
MPDETPPQPRAPRPKDAATLVLVRRDGPRPRVLMGQRSKGHVFMPDKWVFPGGRVDRTDGLAPAAHELSTEIEARLAEGNVRRKPRAFALAAVRETFEETGLIVGKPGAAHGPAPAGWEDYCKHHAAADLSKFDFICRAITPPLRPRRFDARFFFAFAEDVLLDDRSHADGDELLHIKWFTLEEAAHLDLPTVTRIVIGDVAKRLAGESVTPQFLRAGRGLRGAPD